MYGSRRSTKSLTLVIPEHAAISRQGHGLGVFRDREELSGKLRDLEPTGPPDRTYKVRKPFLVTERLRLNYQVVFAGDAAVGKTSFINRITKVFRSTFSVFVFNNNVTAVLGRLHVQPEFYPGGGLPSEDYQGG